MAARIAMVAGEPSGDLLASLVVQATRERDAQAQLYGIGGPRMAAHGFRADWPMEKLAVRGYVEVLKHYREIAGIRRQLRKRLLADPPNVFVGVDAPDFNLDLEAQLRAAGIPTAHFISPSIWAWRGKRIEKIRRAVSHMLVVFPFEEEIYRREGIPATYVGYPLAETIPLEIDTAAARRQLGLDPERPVIGVLPGSRQSEIKYIAATFMQTAARLLQARPRLQVAVPAANPGFAQVLRSLAQEAGAPADRLHVIDGQSHTVLAASDAVLVASGTATLETALFKKPMVIAYSMAWVSWLIMRRMGYLPYVGLPNILAGQFVVPEFLQDRAEPAGLTEAMLFQLEDPDNRIRLHQRFTRLHQDLRRDTARLASEAILSLCR
jgi:lipid-A-disaccharide synthase